MVEVPVNLYLTRHEVDQATLRNPDPISPPAASSADLDQAAAWLTLEGAKPLLYVGLGAAGAGSDLVTLAERLEAPVATTIQGKGVFPESHPLFLWNGFGNAAPPFARQVASQCNRMLAIGCRFGEVGTGGYGITLPGPMLHVDINPEVLGRNFPAELAIAADGGAFVRAVLERLGRETGAPSPALTSALAEGHASVRSEWEATAAWTGFHRSSPPAAAGKSSVPTRSSPPTAATAPSWPWNACASMARAGSWRRWTSRAWDTPCPPRSARSSPGRRLRWSRWPGTARSS